MTILEKTLGIENDYLSLDKESIIINDEKGMYKSSHSCDHITTPTKIYIITNIAHLLQQNIRTDSACIQHTLAKIRGQDKILTELLHTLHGNDLIGVEKPYQIHNGSVRYSTGTGENKEYDEQGRKILRPSGTFITQDTKSFQPINKRFSKDSKYIYWTYHQIKDCRFPEYDICPDVHSFKPLEESNYGCDGKYVFHTFNLVEGAVIENKNYEIINNDQVELLKDSTNNFYSGHTHLGNGKSLFEIEYPYQCNHVIENFLFDGNNVYLVIGMSIYNLTQMYSFTSGETIFKTAENLYKIGDKQFTYDGLLDIKLL